MWRQDDDNEREGVGDMGGGGLGICGTVSGEGREEKKT